MSIYNVGSRRILLVLRSTVVPVVPRQQIFVSARRRASGHVCRHERAGCHMLAPASHQLREMLIAVPLTVNTTDRLRRRRASIHRHLREHDLQFMRISLPGPTRSEMALNDMSAMKARLSRVNVHLALAACARQQDQPLCLVLEDDVSLRPHFLYELARTLDSMPSKWLALHLCPEFVWGGSTPNPSPLRLYGRQTPSTAKRYFSEWPIYAGMIRYMGGPIAFVVRRSHASDMASRLRGPPPWRSSAFGPNRLPQKTVLGDPRCSSTGCLNGTEERCLLFCEREAADMTLAYLHHPEEYVARDPPLCYEKSVKDTSWTHSRFAK